MMRFAQVTAVCVLFAVAHIIAPQMAHAGVFAGEADGDSLVLRGEASPQRFTTLARQDEPDGILRNCVPLDEGRLRCYTADALVPGIAAVSVEAGAGTVTAEDLAGAVSTEFRRIPLSSGGIVIQPSRGWTLVNVDTVFLTQAEPQVFEIVVLGIPLTVVAAPVRYVWSFGDDSEPTETTESGAPWPDATLTHAYRASGTHTVTLVTEWVGEYRIAGSPSWQEIEGVATTSESSPPLEVRPATNVLVLNP